MRSNAAMFRAYDRQQTFLLARAMPRTEDDLTFATSAGLTFRAARVDDKPLTATVAERTEVLQ